MTTAHGGSMVRGGYYWNLSKWSITSVEGDEGVLEAPAEEKFIRLPLLVMVAAAAVMSLGFVIFLPFIGFVMLAYALGKKVAALVHKVAREAVVTVSPEWRAGEAYFAGKPGKEKKAQKGEGGSLGELEKEIAGRRREEDEEKK